MYGSKVKLVVIGKPLTSLRSSKRSFAVPPPPPSFKPIAPKHSNQQHDNDDRRERKERPDLHDKQVLKTTTAQHLQRNHQHQPPRPSPPVLSPKPIPIPSQQQPRHATINTNPSKKPQQQHIPHAKHRSQHHQTPSMDVATPRIPRVPTVLVPSTATDDNSQNGIPQRQGLVGSLFSRMRNLLAITPSNDLPSHNVVPQQSQHIPKHTSNPQQHKHQQQQQQSQKTQSQQNKRDQKRTLPRCSIRDVVSERHGKATPNYTSTLDDEDFERIRIEHEKLKIFLDEADVETSGTRLREQIDAEIAKDDTYSSLKGILGEEHVRKLVVVMGRLQRRSDEESSPHFHRAAMMLLSEAAGKATAHTTVTARRELLSKVRQLVDDATRPSSSAVTLPRASGGVRALISPETPLDEQELIEHLLLSRQLRSVLIDTSIKRRPTPKFDIFLVESRKELDRMMNAVQTFFLIDDDLNGKNALPDPNNAIVDILRAKDEKLGLNKDARLHAIGLDVEFCQVVPEDGQQIYIPAICQISLTEEVVVIIHLLNICKDKGTKASKASDILLSDTHEIIESFRHFMCNPRILKAGVGVTNDCALIERTYFPQTMSSIIQGVVPLESLFANMNLPQRSLYDITEALHLNAQYKHQYKTGPSEWDISLSSMRLERLLYAAEDARVSLEAFNILRIPGIGQYFPNYTKVCDVMNKAVFYRFKAGQYNQIFNEDIQLPPGVISDSDILKELEI